MKILLIAPNLRGRPDVGTNVSPVPLGLLYLAAALRQAGYGRINIVDANALDLSRGEVLARVGSFAPDLVGITSMSIGSGESHALAELIKKADARRKVAVGGAYACATPEAVIRDPNVDFAVVGEGERTVCELVEALEHGKPLSGITGLAYKEGGVPVFNPPRAVIEDVDSIPFPAWDLADMAAYFDTKSCHVSNPCPVSGRVVPIFTSRGCPYGCIYCHDIFGKRVRMRSPENVLREIELVMERYAPDQIEIWDDVFNFDMDRAKRICNGLIGRGIKVSISFPNGLRVDRMDRELVLKLKEAGTQQIFYAVESADPGVQKRIGKNLDLEKAREIIRMTTEVGILTCVSFMLGFPGETKEELLRTLEFAKSVPFHIAVFHYVTPRPNTPLEALLRKRGIELNSVRLYHYKKFSINISAVSDAELKSIWARAYAGFYLRPNQMWRIWKALPYKKQIFRRIPGILKFSIAR